MRGSTAGFTGTLAGAPHVDSPLLRWADVLFSCAVITPTSIIYWKSTWTLMDLYIYVDDPASRSATCIIFGLCSGLLLCLFQTQFKKYICPDKCGVVWCIVSRLYSEIAGVTCIGAFKGVWDLIDQRLGQDEWSVAWTTLSSVLALAALRALRNIGATPFVVVLDSPQDYFDIPTYFKTSTKEPVYYLLDCLFSVVVVGCLVITVWRSLWTSADMLFFPDDSLKSIMMSLTAGYILAVVIFAVQTPMQWIAARLQGAPKLLLGDVYNLVAFAITISIWRGFWMYMDEFVFPEYPEIVNWTSHVLSFIVLITLDCFNTVLVRGVYFDTEDGGDEFMTFPCHYIRIYYHRRKMRKKFRNAIAVEKSRLEDSTQPLQIDVQKQ